MRIAPSVPIFEARTKIARLTPLNNVNPASASIAHTKGFAFCGIGNPENFFGLLERENYDLAGQMRFRDHHRYALSDVKKLENAAEKAVASYFLTTAKDAVKLAGLPFKKPVFIIEIAFSIDREADFKALL